jgi:hypothetical protein
MENEAQVPEMERPIGIEHLNLGKVRFNHLRRWNGGIHTKLDVE